MIAARAVFHRSIRDDVGEDIQPFSSTVPASATIGGRSSAVPDFLEVANRRCYNPNVVAGKDETVLVQRNGRNRQWQRRVKRLTTR